MESLLVDSKDAMHLFFESANIDILDEFVPSPSSPDTTSGSSDASPSHWSSDFSMEPSFDLDVNKLLYGDNLIQDTIPLPPISSPFSGPVSPIEPSHSNLPSYPSPQPATLQIDKPSKYIPKKRPRTADPPAPPASNSEPVVLPKDTLLKLTSVGMDKYVETLAHTRQLSAEEQQELKKQKRLIKNRESAQMSREKRRLYVDQLEAKVNDLNMELNALRAENTTLRQALGMSTSSVTIPNDPAVRSTNLKSQIATKMGMFSVGRDRPGVAKAGGVCLLVLITFALFMNSGGPTTSKFSIPRSSLNLPSGDSAAMVRSINMGASRSLMEAAPLVEDLDDELVVIDPVKGIGSRAISPQSHSHDLPVDYAQAGPLDVKSGGIFKVSYALDSHYTHMVENNNNNNKSIMLLLDPRPDLDDEVPVVSPTSAAASTVTPSSSTDIIHVTRVPPKVARKLPPMIINLVMPDSLMNGSNPLLGPEELSTSDSLLELTCKVIDLSLTTTAPPRHSP